MEPNIAFNKGTALYMYLLSGLNFVVKTTKYRFRSVSAIHPLTPGHDSKKR